MNIKSKPLRCLRQLSIIALLPILVLTLVMSALAADPDDFTHRLNLSRTGQQANLRSGPPHLAANGDTLVVVWSDGHNPEDESEAGNIYLQTASESDDYWRPRVKAFAATDAEWAINPTLALDPNDPTRVHVAWSQGRDCNFNPLTGNIEPGGSIAFCKFQDIRYTQCTIAGDINRCEPAQDVAFTRDEELQYISPYLAVEAGDGDVHIIWVRARSRGEEDFAADKLYYARSTNDGADFSSLFEVNAANGNTDFSFTHANNRLHLAWEEAVAPANNNDIRYFFDDDLTDDTLSPSANIRSFSGFGVDYDDGEAANPALVHQGDWSILIFDVQHEASADDERFGLFYDLTDDNGDTWNGVNRLPESSGFAVEDFRSKEPDLGLRPSPVITGTPGDIRIQVVWHESKQIGFAGKRYRAMYSDILLTDTVGQLPDLVWSTPATVTHAENSNGRDTTNPALAVTTPPAGQGEAHMVYLELADVARMAPDRRLDVFYEGGIVGTIDPQYLLDSFQGSDGNPAGQDGTANFKRVEPTLIQTSATSLEVTLDYVIAFTNTGDMVAIGVGMTDTLPLGTALDPTSLEWNTGTANQVDDRTLAWHGDVDIGQNVTIKFALVTNDDLPRPPTRVVNRMILWNKGSQGQPIISSTATTIIAQSLNYLPVIAKW